MNVMNPPPDRDDHVRHLLDQRAARADPHGRFPSLSEFSDSPSVYSRAYFSPRPVDKQLDGNFDFVVPVQARGPPSQPRSPMSDRERLYSLPDESSLDLDDDSHSTYAYSNSHEDDDLSPLEEELPRISTYGPKMTVHSRAPWELGEDDDPDEEEREPSSSRRSKTKKTETGKRVWGLGKNSSEKRPSTESNRSQGKPKQSIEFTNNGSTLMALAQASMSSTSLALGASPQPTLRDKLSISRLRSRTPSNTNTLSHNLEAIDTRLPPLPPQSGNTSPVSRLMRTMSPAQLSPVEATYSDNSSRSPTPNTPQHEYFHPYANPALVSRAAAPKPISPLPSPKHPPSSALSGNSNVNSSDSNATLTDTTTTSSMFQSRSNMTVSSLTPVTSLSSVSQSIGDYSPTRVQGKGISGPIASHRIPLPPPPVSHPNGAAAVSIGVQEKSPNMRSKDQKLVSGTNPVAAFPGWNEGSAASSIKLISLEEAQAQARERSRSATANPVISSSLAAGPSKCQGQASADTESRLRSTSAGGGKAKAEFAMRPPMPGDGTGSSVPARMVQRKKSGFMRLFNAKERDRALYSPPPPVPSMSSSDTVATSSSTTSQTPRSRKGSTPRVPVPSLSPSILGEVGSINADSGSSSDTRSEASGSKESVVARERQLSARRNAPGLSIVTSPTSVNTSRLHPPVPFSAVSEYSPHGHTVTITPTASDSFTSAASEVPHIPNSAPPGMSDFVALSLRPVSTLFSPSLADQLSPGAMSRPSLDVDYGTPTTGTTAISPLSPDFPVRSYPSASDDKNVPMIAHDDQSPAVQALQEQILMARRAWQRQIWELEGQVRDLKAEVDDLRAEENSAPYCSTCGRGNVGRPNADSGNCLEDLRKVGVKVGVVNRPRARTGVGSRFASGT